MARGARPWVLAAVALVGSVAACARQAAPPGGPPDARPPVLVATTPDTFASLPGFEGPVRFEFDERISEQVSGGDLNEAVTVSPLTGTVRVDHGRRALTVELGGGFRPGLVYRVTLRPVVRDMFGNTIRYPFELVFSTGGTVEPTTVAGEVWDRITGRGLADHVLNATGPDSLIHLAITDEDGIYAFRYLPSGTYDLVAFEDRNASETLDPNEPRGRADFAVSSGDTLFVDVPVLPQDTTPAILLGAEALDSLRVVLRFDDYLEPTLPLDEVSIAVESAGAGTPAVVRRFHEHEYRDHVAAVRDSLMQADSARADSLVIAVDTTGAGAPDTVVVPEPPLAEPDTAGAVLDTVPAVGLEPVPGPPELSGPPPPGADVARRRGRILPGRRIVIVLDEPIPVGEPYQVTVGGVVNLNGLAGGGGEVPFTREMSAPDGGGGADDPGQGPAPEPAAADSLGGADPGAPTPDTLLLGAGLEGARR